MQMGIASIGTCVLFGVILLIIYFSKKRVKMGVYVLSFCCYNMCHNHST